MEIFLCADLRGNRQADQEGEQKGSRVPPMGQTSGSPLTDEGVYGSNSACGGIRRRSNLEL